MIASLMSTCSKGRRVWGPYSNLRPTRSPLLGTIDLRLSFAHSGTWIQLPQKLNEKPPCYNATVSSRAAKYQETRVVITRGWGAVEN